jgi:hypothetical protein
MAASYQSPPPVALYCSKEKEQADCQKEEESILYDTKRRSIKVQSYMTYGVAEFVTCQEIRLLSSEKDTGA